MKSALILGSTLLLAVAGAAQAVTCGVACNARYRETVGTISQSEDWHRIQDFKANCVQHYKGELSSDNVTHYCEVRSTEDGYGSGYGADVASARLAARQDCSDGFRKNSSTLWVLINYSSDYSCN